MLYSYINNDCCAIIELVKYSQLYIVYIFLHVFLEGGIDPI